MVRDATQIFFPIASVKLTRVTFSKLTLYRISSFTNLKFYQLKIIYNVNLEGMIVWFPCILHVAETKNRSCLNKILSNELL